VQTNSFPVNNGIQAYVVRGYAQASKKAAQRPKTKKGKKERPPVSHPKPEGADGVYLQKTIQILPQLDKLPQGLFLLILCNIFRHPTNNKRRIEATI
jgi:hypothetical protein